MQDRGLSEFKSFSGFLQSNACSVPLAFRVRINHFGEVEFDFGKIALTQDTWFIMTNWNSESSKLSCFSLSGKSEDGTEFKTENLQFTSPNRESCEENGNCMSPSGSCLRAEFHRKLQESVPNPIIRIHVKGFQNFRQLTTKSSLGTITMGGDKSIDDPDTITGYISLHASSKPANLTVWRAEADKLLEHVRHVMSFGASAMLQAPIIEYFVGDDLEVLALSQSRQASAPMRTIHYLNQQPIFDAAVRSFFSPPFKVNNLFIAIEWFVMDATYKEVRLVNAMTVLENLIASNLDDDDVFILQEGEFKKTKRVLKKVIGECMSKWSTSENKDTQKELVEKLSDLNRRSLFQKLNILKVRWSVPLEDISEDKIRAAKKARDSIVHQGHYDMEGKELWEHVTVVREVVIRFIFTAIGYQGSYFSYLGGYYESLFPPQVVILNTD
jgi:hypothetical protein